MSDFNIKGISSNQFLPELASKAGGDVAGEFSKVLSETIGDVNSAQQNAVESVKNLSLGNDVSIHNVMIDMEKASIKFEMMSEVRNKIIEAYQEVFRMQV